MIKFSFKKIHIFLILVKNILSIQSELTPLLEFSRHFYVNFLMTFIQAGKHYVESM